MRCKNTKLCTEEGTKVIVTDLNKNNQTDFVLSSRAFRAMAVQGKDQDILKLGILDIQYKRWDLLLYLLTTVIRIQYNTFQFTTRVKTFSPTLLIIDTIAVSHPKGEEDRMYY